MKKRTSTLILALGICLVMVSLAWLLVMHIRMEKGAEYSSRIGAKLAEILPENTASTPGLYPDAGMPVLQLENRDYVAVLEIPAFGLTLPVADHWDSGQLTRTPARFHGSAYDGSLIIGGTDHPRQFGFCGEIEYGTVVTVTDMTGARFTYTVSGVDRGKHAESQWLADPDCDLTLFCQDVYAMEYIAVRCVLAHQ